MEKQLTVWADTIEQVLAQHHAPAHIIGGTLHPRAVTYNFSVPPGLEEKAASLAQEIAAALEVAACHISRKNGHLTLEMPRPNAPKLSLTNLCHRLSTEGPRGRDTIPPATAVLGLDREGAPLLLRFSSPNVRHVLVAGAQGAGKMTLLRSIVASLAMHNSQRRLQLVLIDPNGHGLAPFKNLPHLLEPVTDQVEQAIFFLQRVSAEIQRRSKDGRSEPRLVVVVSELVNLLQREGSRVEKLLVNLTRRGHPAGVHLVAGCRSPDAAVMSELIQSNFPIRLVGILGDSAQAAMASGIPNLNTEMLHGNGDFFIVARDQVSRVQAAHIDDDEIQTLIQQLDRSQYK